MSTSAFSHADLLTVRAGGASRMIDLTPRLVARIRRSRVVDGWISLTSGDTALSVGIARGRCEPVFSADTQPALKVSVTAGRLDLARGAAIVAAVRAGAGPRGLRLELHGSDEFSLTS